KFCPQPRPNTRKHAANRVHHLKHPHIPAVAAGSAKSSVLELQPGWSREPVRGHAPGDSSSGDGVSPLPPGGEGRTVGSSACSTSSLPPIARRSSRERERRSRSDWLQSRPRTRVLISEVEMGNSEKNLATAVTDLKKALEETKRYLLLVESVEDYAIFVLDPKGYVP